MDEIILKLRQACVPREHYPEIDLGLIAARIAELQDTDNEEFATMLSELAQYFDQIASTAYNNAEHLAKLTAAYIQTVPWDNYKDDETEDGEDIYYSLGSVWYNRLNWMLEDDDDEVKKLAKELMDGGLVELMDLLEKEAEVNI